MESRRPERFHCIKDMKMSDGSIAFIKGKTYLGVLKHGGSGLFQNESTRKIIHTINYRHVGIYLRLFKYGK